MRNGGIDLPHFVSERANTANNMPLLKDNHFGSFYSRRRIENPTLKHEMSGMWPTSRADERGGAAGSVSFSN